MPSPVGHSLVGVCCFLLARNYVSTRQAKYMLLASIVIASLPDLDVVPGLLLGRSEALSAPDDAQPHGCDRCRLCDRWYCTMMVMVQAGVAQRLVRTARLAPLRPPVDDHWRARKGRSRCCETQSSSRLRQKRSIISAYSRGCGAVNSCCRRSSRQAA